MGIQSIPQSSPLADLGDNLNATVQNGMQLILKLAIEQRRTQRKEAFKELDRRERLFREENKSQLDEVNKQQRAMRKGISVIEGLPKGKITDVDRAEIEDALTAYFGGGKAAQERAEKLVNKYGKGFFSRDSSLINNVKEKILPILRRGEERTSDYKTAYHNLIAGQRFNTPIDEEVERLRALREEQQLPEETAGEAHPLAGEGRKWKEGILAPLGNMFDLAQKGARLASAVDENIPEGEHRIIASPFAPPMFVSGKKDAEKIKNAPSLAESLGLPTSASLAQAREARGEPDRYKGASGAKSLATAARRLWENQAFPGSVALPGLLGVEALGEGIHMGAEKAGASPEVAEGLGVLGSLGGAAFGGKALRAIDNLAAKRAAKRLAQGGGKGAKAGGREGGVLKKVGEGARKVYSKPAQLIAETKMAPEVNARAPKEQSFFPKPKAVAFEDVSKKFFEKENRQIPSHLYRKQKRLYHNQAEALSERMIARANPEGMQAIKGAEGDLGRAIQEVGEKHGAELEKVRAMKHRVEIPRKGLSEAAKIVGKNISKTAGSRTLEALRQGTAGTEDLLKLFKSLEKMSEEGRGVEGVGKVLDLLSSPGIRLTPGELYQVRNYLGSQIAKMRAKPGASTDVALKAAGELKQVLDKTYFEAIAKGNPATAKNMKRLDDTYHQLKNIEAYREVKMEKGNALLDLYTSSSKEGKPRGIQALQDAFTKKGWEKVRKEAFDIKRVLDNMAATQRFRLIRGLTNFALVTGSGLHLLLSDNTKNKRWSGTAFTASTAAAAALYIAAMLNYRRYIKPVRHPLGKAPLGELANRKNMQAFDRFYKEYEKEAKIVARRKTQGKKP